MNNLFRRGLTRTVDSPKSVIAVLLLITAISLVGRFRPEWVTEPLSSAAAPEIETEAESDQSTPPEPKVSPLSLDGADVILIVDCERFFTAEGSEAIRHVVGSLETADVVKEVFWLDDAPPINMFSLRDSIFPSRTASQRQFDAAKEKALANPLIGGQLLSGDAETLLLLIELDWLFVESDEQCTEEIRRIAQSAAADHPEVKMSFLITGRVPNHISFHETHSTNQTRFQLIGYGMVLLMALVLFRGVRAVLIVALAPALGVFWTTGVLHFFDLENNPFNEIVLPILISLVGFTDGVHLMVEIRRRRAEGRTAREAARDGIDKVGFACLLTSVTTAIGLGSLATAHHDVVRDFGWSCVIGVILTFLAVILFIPLACRSPLGRGLHVGHGHGLIDRNLGRIGGLIDFVLRRPATLSFTAIFATIALALTAATLRPDERIAGIFPASSEPARALAHLDEAFEGMEPGRVEIAWSDEIASDSGEVLAVIREVELLLRAEEKIGRPISLYSFVEILPGEGTDDERMAMSDLMPPPLKRAFFSPEKREARVNFRVRDLGIAAYGPAFERVEAELRRIEREHPEFTLTLDGRSVWRWKNLYQIVVDLAVSLGTATVVIFLVLTFAYRSLRLGLISLIPNLFPLAITGTYLVLTGGSLELASVCAFTVCLGIAVDDTIHFLTRFQEELDHHPREAAIRNAFIGTGTALIMTTIVLCIGFSTVLTSELREQRIFATMGALTIGSALAGDLLFLPALLSYFRPEKEETEPEQIADSVSEPSDP